MILLASVSSAKCQVATGSYPYGSFENLGPDTVNLGNLNVHLGIPVLHKAGRGIPFNYDLSFDNSVWYPVTSNGTTFWLQPKISGGPVQWKLQRAMSHTAPTLSARLAEQY